MYWIDRKAMREVLRNPYNSKENMKDSIVEKIFKSINENYHDDYDNKWTNNTIPLNYFVKKFVQITGSDAKEISEAFRNYFEKEE